MGDRYYSTSTAFLEALAEAGISCMFASLGSDHPGLIEAGRGRRPAPRRLTPAVRKALAGVRVPCHHAPHAALKEN